MPSPGLAEPFRFWPFLRRARRFLVEAVRGSHLDFTEAPLDKAILLLAIPMVLEMAMESLFAICDVFFVSRLGPEAVATIGLTEAALTLVFAVAVGLSMGTTALVARRIGERDSEGAAVTAAQALWIGVLVSVLVAAAGFLLARPILSLMGAEPAVIEVGVGYTRVITGGIGTLVMLFLLNAVFRGAGDAAIAMRVLTIANLLNIALDPCLIFGWGPFPRLGVTGAAVATTIGRSCGVLLQLWVLFRSDGRIRLEPRHLKPAPKVAFKLLTVSAGGILQFLIATASWVGLVRLVSVFGSAAVAGYTIAVRIVMFTILPAWGLSNAAATLVGQNLGAAKPDRAEAAVWRTGLYNGIFMGLVGALFLGLAPWLIGVFTQEPAALAVGVDCLRFLSYGYVFYAYGMVMVQAFNGAGDTFTPTVINFFCYWLFQIPLAWVLSRPVGLEHRGVFLAITIAESLIAVVGMAWFRKGKWKTRQV